MVYMVVHTQERATSAGTTAAEKPARAVQKRWPLFVSVFGAIGVSVVLWAAIFFTISILVDLVG
jgi:hypothetical protein